MSQEKYGPKKGLLPLERIHYRFHIMPVEGYLYCANVEHLLVEHQIPYDKWFKMEAEERQALWDKGIDPANPEPLIVQCAEQVRYAVHKRKHARKDEESLVY